MKEHIPRTAELADKDLFQVGGALSPNSRLYVEREVDKRLAHFAHSRREAAVVWGPRMIGKSSLIYRVITKLRELPRICVLIDFQGLGGIDFTTIVREIAIQISKQVGGNEIIRVASEIGAGKESPIYQFLDFLQLTKAPIVLAFDEVDALKTRNYSNEFFAFLRCVYEHQYFERTLSISLLISSTLPAGYLQLNKNVSPWNIGVAYELCNFTVAETEMLLKLANLQLSRKEVARLYQLTGGHPFLVHAAARLLWSGAKASDICDIERIQDASFNMFIELGRADLSRNPQIKRALHRFAAGESLSGRVLIDLIEHGFLVRGANGVAFASEVHHKMIDDMTK